MQSGELDSIFKTYIDKSHLRMFTYSQKSDFFLTE